MVRRTLIPWIACSLLLAVGIPGAASATTTNDEPGWEYDGEESWEPDGQAGPDFEGDSDGEPSSASGSTPMPHMISLLWADTGTDTLTLSSFEGAEQHILYVVLTATGPSITAIDISFLFDTAGANGLDFLFGTENGALTNTPGLTLLEESGPGQQGLLTDFRVVFPGGIEDQTLTLGSIVFNVNGNALGNPIEVSPAVLNELDDGVLDRRNRDIATLFPDSVQLKGATVELPEPTSASLMLSGVALLVWASRGRRSPRP